MTTVAIVCPGPSLPAEWAARTHTPELVVAVNGAADLIQCDWWITGDCEAFGLWPSVRPRLGLWHQTAKRHLPEWSKPLLCRHWDELRCPRHPKPWHYSIQAAVAVASLCSCGEEVELYGATWDGNGYACHHTAAAYDAGVNRWAQERANVAATAEIYDVNLLRMTTMEPIKNRMARRETRQWTPAATTSIQVRTILCPHCSDPRTRVRVTRPEKGIVQMSCLKCGAKFCVRDADTASPQVSV